MNGEGGAHKYNLNTSTSAPESQDSGVSGDDSPLTSPVTSPPYWVQSHHRSISNISVESIPAGAITLQDNTSGEDAKNEACWAKSVYIEDHFVVKGSRTAIGAFVVWNITVETLHVSSKVKNKETGSDYCRVDRYAFESDTLNSTTSAINSYKLSLALKLPCRLYPQRA